MSLESVAERTYKGMRVSACAEVRKEGVPRVKVILYVETEHGGNPYGLRCAVDLTDAADALVDQIASALADQT